LTTFTPEQKLKAIRRELGMRRRCYPQWVAKGAMSQDTASQEIAVFEAIATDYQKLIEIEQPNLFEVKP
jgi:hypothetical protein